MCKGHRVARYTAAAREFLYTVRYSKKILQVIEIPSGLVIVSTCWDPPSRLSLSSIWQHIQMTEGNDIDNVGEGNQRAR